MDHKTAELETARCAQQQELKELQERLEDNQHELAVIREQLKATSAQLEVDHKKLEETRREVSEGNARAINVEVTAYDLSEQSCNKGPGHPAYGLTATGRNLAGQTLESARAIAVDPRLVPLGSKVRLTFKDPEMKKYNGVYTACDTGGAIQGNIIDLFAGDGAHDLCMHIGRRQAKLVVL